MVAIRASTVLLHHSEYQHPMEAGGIGNGLLQLKKKKNTFIIHGEFGFSNHFGSFLIN